jgi:aspartate/tyrosine/aromatic aminotransferase
MYSSPPGHGAAIAALVLSDPALLAEWKEELRGMAGRIQQMRAALLQALHQVGLHGRGLVTLCLCHTTV